MHNYGQPESYWWLMTWFMWALVFIAASVTAAASAFKVEQTELGIVERFGKFLRVAKPGLGFKIPYVDALDTVDIRLLQLNFEAEVKTRDSVFITVAIAVQYKLIVDRVYEAYYRLENEEHQIRAYVFDAARARIPTMSLNEVFESQESLATYIKEQLDDRMAGFGWEIESALVTNIVPDAKVVSALNEIQAATALRQAAEQKGEANRLLVVANARAEAEAKALQGKGVADQRAAIVSGLQQSVEAFKEATGVNVEEVMMLVLLTQYFDALHAIGTSSNSSTIFLPHSPGGLTDLMGQLRAAMVQAESAAPKPNGKLNIQHNA